MIYRSKEYVYYLVETDELIIRDSSELCFVYLAKEEIILNAIFLGEI